MGLRPRIPDPPALAGRKRGAGPTHASYKHGAFSTYFTGVLKAGARFYDELQVLASLRDELAVNKALIAHKLGEINARRVQHLLHRGPEGGVPRMRPRLRR